ncbi:MAG: cysteine desulfurase family protein [Melioribacteraceae bacterium]|nr:MAG: cysteine desulfurase family protein [Melioribacteraceae bacterium]
MKVYFDNAATTKLHPKVLEKMIPLLTDEYGNPSSIHSFGRKVRVAIEEARETIADFINADTSEIYFVSNGTEANNLPLFGIAKTNFDETGKNKLITSAAEHTCVLETFNALNKLGFSTNQINVTSDCEIDKKELLNNLDDQTSLISLIHVNNETGSVNDIKSLTRNTIGTDRYFHTDAVQSFGKIKIDVKELGVNSLSASAHKLHGPKGIGVVYVKSGTPLTPMILGGSQERNRRGGTEFAAGIIGFAEAIKIATQNMDENFSNVQKLRNYFISALGNSSIENYEINCENTEFPFILSLTFSSEFYKNDSEAMLMYLDINGVAASNGAACTSGTLKPSHVIMSMGKTKEDAQGTIRLSFSALNTFEEVDYTIEILEKMSKKFKK